MDFSKANEEKIKILQQDVSAGMNMTCHKILDKSSFVIKKKKKVEDSKVEKPSSSKGTGKQLKLTEIPAKKKKVPATSSGQKDQSEESMTSESEDSSEEEDEDIDTKLKNFIQAGFFI